MSDLPWLEFQIPVAPSVNQYMSRLGNKTPKVQKWIGQADIAWVMSRQHLPRIQNKFETNFIFGHHSGDLSNRLKPIEDWLQSREFIKNDRFARRILLEWGEDLGMNIPDQRVLVRLRPFMR